jgi:hypothetical protein
VVNKLMFLLWTISGIGFMIISLGHIDRDKFYMAFGVGILCNILGELTLQRKD